MKKIVLVFMLSVVVAAFVMAPAYGAQPDQAADPNVFHSSEPYILSIAAMKDNFSCDQQKDSNGNPIYGNTVFVPLNGINIRILLQSVPGKREGEMPPLQVVDPCTASIDGDPAHVQIPKNAHGYRVYARPLGKLTLAPYTDIKPQLIVERDASGTELVYLGQMTPTGFETPYSAYSRKKGQWTPQDITPLFEWSGNICSLTWCSTCIKTSSMCCASASGPKPPSPKGGTPGTTTTTTTTSTCSPFNGSCPSGTKETPVFCKTYEDEWLLDIGDFVTYLSGTDTNVKKLEVRFYPVK